MLADKVVRQSTACIEVDLRPVGGRKNIEINDNFLKLTPFDDYGCKFAQFMRLVEVFRDFEEAVIREYKKNEGCHDRGSAGGDNQ